MYENHGSEWSVFYEDNNNNNNNNDKEEEERMTDSQVNVPCGEEEREGGGSIVRIIQWK